MKVVAFLESVLWNVQMWPECNCLETTEANVPVPANQISKKSRNQAASVSAHKDCSACLKLSGGHVDVVNHCLLNYQNLRMLW
jgi:hypothetical protein